MKGLLSHNMVASLYGILMFFIVWFSNTNNVMVACLYQRLGLRDMIAYPCRIPKFFNN